MSESNFEDFDIEKETNGHFDFSEIKSALNKDAEERRQNCVKELNAVLEKYRCKLDYYIIIKEDETILGANVVPLINL